MNEIDTWEAGCKVRFFDWIDGKHIYLHMEYFAPGQSLGSAPTKELSVLLEKTEETEYRLRYFLNSIVNHFMFGALNHERTTKEECHSGIEI